MIFTEIRDDTDLLQELDITNFFNVVSCEKDGYNSYFFCLHHRQTTLPKKTVVKSCTSEKHQTRNPL